VRVLTFKPFASDILKNVVMLDKIKGMEELRARAALVVRSFYSFWIQEARRSFSPRTAELYIAGLVLRSFDPFKARIELIGAFPNALEWGTSDAWSMVPQFQRHMKPIHRNWTSSMIKAVWAKTQGQFKGAKQEIIIPITNAKQRRENTQDVMSAMLAENLGTSGLSTPQQIASSSARFFQPKIPGMGGRQVLISHRDVKAFVQEQYANEVMALSRNRLKYGSRIRKSFIVKSSDIPYRSVTELTVDNGRNWMHPGYKAYSLHKRAEDKLASFVSRYFGDLT